MRQVKSSKTNTLDGSLVSFHTSRKQHPFLDPGIRIWRFSQITQTYSLTLFLPWERCYLPPNLAVYNFSIKAKFELFRFQVINRSYFNTCTPS